MLVLRNPALTSSIANPDIRRLVELRFAQVCAGEAYDYDQHGYMILVESGDSAESLEVECGCPILHDTSDGTRFGDLDFAPSFEVVEEHPGCYELVFILNDNGFGIGIFIPKAEGVDPELLSMCAAFATPAPDLTPP